MKFSQLQALQEIAQAGSIQGAARSLSISQPALSKTVRALEMEIGAELLERNARGVSLTNCGQLVLKRSRIIQREMDRLQEDVRWFKDEMNGSLSVGLTPLGAAQDVGAAVANLRREHPAIEIKLFDLRPNQILQGLRDGSLDLGIITNYGALEIPGFECRLIKRYGTTLIAGGSRSRDPVSIEELLTDEWIDTDMTETQSYVAAVMSERGLPMPEKVLKCSSVYLCLDLAARLGAIFYSADMSLPFLTKQFDDGLLTPLNLTSNLPTMNVMVVSNDTQLLSPAARQFAKLLRMEAK